MSQVCAACFPTTPCLPAAVATCGNNSFMPLGSSSCPLLTEFWVRSWNGFSWDVITMFILESCNAFFLSFLLRYLRMLLERYLYLVVAFFNLSKIQSFFFPFWANTEFWSVLIYQVVLTRSLAKQSLAWCVVFHLKTAYFILFLFLS